MIDWQAFGNATTGLLTASSILWALHESLVWAFFRAEAPDEKLGRRLQALTLTGMAAVLCGMGALLSLTLGWRVAAISLFIGAFVATTFFVLREAFYYFSLVHSKSRGRAPRKMP